MMISSFSEPVSEAVPVDALSRLLDELATVLMSIDRDTYSAVSSSVSGSIGGHVRHLLDHVAAFVEISNLALLDYDHRQRGTAVEVDPMAALSQIYRLQHGLERLQGHREDEHIRIRTQISAGGRTITNWSTIGRELAFVLSHTIHHQAIIALLLEPYRDVPLPERFGYAPSTPLAS